MKKTQFLLIGLVVLGSFLLTNTSDATLPSPTVTVLSPNGGETWTQGSTHNITWSAPTSASSVRIILNYARPICTTRTCPLYPTTDVQPYTLARSVPNTGSFFWTINNSLDDNRVIPIGTYTVTIADATPQITGTYSSVLPDTSDAPFTIATVTSTITPAPTPTPTPEPINQSRIYSLSEIYDGDLIRGQGDIAVWIVKIVGEKRYKRWLFGPQIFGAYGHLGFNKVKNISKITLNNFDTSNLIRKFDAAKVYELTDFVPGVRAVRRWIPTVEVFLQRGFDFDSVYIVNQREPDLYPEGAAL